MNVTIFSYYVTSVNKFSYNFVGEIQKCGLTFCTIKIDVDIEIAVQLLILKKSPANVEYLQRRQITF